MKLSPSDWWEKLEGARIERDRVRAAIRKTADRAELEDLAIEEAAIQRRLNRYAEQYTHAQSREQVDATTPSAAVVPQRSFGPAGGAFLARRIPHDHHPRNRKAN